MGITTDLAFQFLQKVVQGADPEAFVLQRFMPGRPAVGLLFYRAHWISGNLQAVDALFPDFDDREGLHREAIRFATAKGVRNGRTAQQFYRQFAGEQDLGRLK